MNLKTALLVPGQGTPLDGVREWIEEKRPDLLEAAIEIVGEDPFPRVLESTRWAQPAMVCASLARWSMLELEAPDAIFGHSLGEIVALAIGGAFGEREALALATARAAAMDDAGTLEPGGMAAIRRADIETATALAAKHDLVIACDNAPGQIILAGSLAGLDAAAEEAAQGKGRLRRLEVSAAFHSPLMVPALDGLAAALDKVQFSELKIPVWSGVTAAPIDDPRQRLLDGLTHPVLYRPGLLALHAAGFRNFIDVGPGNVVAGLANKTFPEAEFNGENAVNVTVAALDSAEVESSNV